MLQKIAAFLFLWYLILEKTGKFCPLWSVVWKGWVLRKWKIVKMFTWFGTA